MSAERPNGPVTEITEDQILKAKEIAGNHPVITAIRQHRSEITQFLQGVPTPTNNPKREPYLRENSGFLADAMVEVGRFSLKPLEIVAIWSEIVEIFPSNLRYLVTEAVSAAYAVQEMKDPKWKTFPRRFIEIKLDELPLPKEFSGDREDLLHVKTRLDEIGSSLSVLYDYVYQGERKFGKTIVFPEHLKDPEGIEKRLSSLPGTEGEFDVVANFREGWGFEIGCVNSSLKILERNKTG